jgi:hypothetical protein
LLHEGDAFAGRLFVQGRVTQGNRIGRFDDVAGAGWVLLSPLADPLAQLDDDLARWFRSIGGIGVHVGDGGPIADADGTYRDWFNDAGVAVALQRPDFYLFGTAAGIEDTKNLVQALRHAL